MNRQKFTVGTPLLLALSLVSAVSLSARLYHDHRLTQAVQASIHATETLQMQTH